MRTSTEWQLDIDAARQYEKILAAYILGPAAKELVEWADLKKDAKVLDIGCGTGTATRYAAQKIGGEGSAIGIDINEGMIRMARSIPFGGEVTVKYFQQDAYKIEFDENKFDAVICAQSLQFFKEKEKALNEMLRVLKPGGEIYLSSWATLPENPYFEAVAEAVSEWIGDDVSLGLKAALSLSDPGEIYRLLERSDFTQIMIVEKEFELQLPDLESFVPDHINATPMSEAFNNSEKNIQEKLKDDAVNRLEKYRNEIGVLVPFRSYFAKALKLGHSEE